MEQEKTAAQVQQETHEPPIRLAICIPTRDEWDYEFAMSLCNLYYVLGKLSAGEKPMIAFQEFIINGSIIDKQRNQLLGAALEWNPTHLLWLDTDMIFPRNAVFRLLSHNKDIVAANYTTRRHPPIPTMWTRLPDPETQDLGEKLYTTDISTGLAEVEGGGFGLVLMRASIFHKFTPPAFSTVQHESGAWMGEDVYFFKKARAAGIQVFVDHDLSKEVGHVGRMVYRPLHAEAMREYELELTGSKIIAPGDALCHSPPVPS